jgi:hypothetical protein
VDIRRDQNARESWWVKNLTNKTITVGDLLLLPVIKPGKSVDLLRFYTREKISHSTVLTSLVKSGKLRLNKKKLVPNDLPGIISTADIDEAITPAEENERGTGTGTGTGVHNELTGLQGGTTDEYYHLTESDHDALGSLFPPAAPDLDDVSVVLSGVSGSLSFDASNPIAEATYVGVDDASNTGQAPSVSVDGVYTASGDRAGIIDASTDITGTLNDDVAAHAYSYPANAFGNAELGDLILEVNGVEVRTIDLTTAGAVNDGAATSGFNISDKAPCEFSNGDPFPAFQYRTGTYRVDSGDANLNLGWNYARVIHRISGSDTVTNYVDWVVDGNAVDTSYSGDNFDNLVMSGSVYLSGVRYYTDGDADYDITIDHGQRNTYITSGAITFAETNGTIPNVSFNVTAGVETRTETLTDQTFTISSNIRLLNENITARTNVNRTINANESNDPSTTQTISSILMDDLIDHTSTSDAVENFVGEGYRKASNISLTDTTGYASGAGNGPSVWDPTLDITSGGAGYNDGLLICNGRISYPTNTSDIANIPNGDFTGITYSYGGQPDYSTATGDRVYIRYFYNSSSRQNFRFNVDFTGSGSFVSVATGASGNNLTCELLAPNTTQDSVGTIEWKDMATAYVTEDDIGCFASTYGATIPTAWGVTLGPRSTSDSGNVVLVRITASAGWTGYIDDITCTFL